MHRPALKAIALILFPALVFFSPRGVFAQEVQGTESPYIVNQMPTAAMSFSLYSFYSTQQDQAYLKFEYFELQQHTQLTELVFWGAAGYNIPLTELSDNFYFIIYPEKDGKPSGHPAQQEDNALFRIQVPTASDQFNISANPESRFNRIIIDLNEHGIVLPSGVYWFTLYFDNRFFDYGFNWQLSDKRNRPAWHFNLTNDFFNATGVRPGEFYDILQSNYAFVLKGDALD